MIPTRRFVLAIAALLALSIASLAWAPLRSIVAVLDFALVTAACFDALRAGDPSALRVARRLPQRAGLSREFERTLEVQPGAARGLVLELHEEFPESWAVTARTVQRSGVAPDAADPSGGPDLIRFDSEGAPARLVRGYRASRRGVHALGAVRLRVRGPLGLVARQSRLAGLQQIEIEPALDGLARRLALARSDRWSELGARTESRRGLALEFDSLRDYSAGDDVRAIDWKASARRGRLILREFRVERGQELLILIDAGRRMGSVGDDGTLRGWSKLDHALDAALQLAAVALAEGDRVGCLVFDSQPRTWIPPRRDRAQFERLRRALFDQHSTGRESDLGRALAEIAVRHRRRATIVVLSDVADPLSVARQRDALALRARTHGLIFAALDDPHVRHSSEGRDAPGPILSPIRAASFALLAERERALAELRRAGLRVLDSLPAEAAGRTILAWLDERRARGSR